MIVTIHTTKPQWNVQYINYTKDLPVTRVVSINCLSMVLLCLEILSSITCSTSAFMGKRVFIPSTHCSVSKIQGPWFLVISVKTHKSGLTVISKPLVMLFSLWKINKFDTEFKKWLNCGTIWWWEHFQISCVIDTEILQKQSCHDQICMFYRKTKRNLG